MKLPIFVFEIMYMAKKFPFFYAIRRKSVRTGAFFADFSI
jgi:hypothetical protein